MTPPLMEIDGVTKRFAVQSDVFGRATAQLTALKDVSLTLEPGETLGIVGESGSGKSTLGRIMLRLLDASEGSVRLAGTDVTTLKGRDLIALRRDAQMVFQDPFTSLNPRMKVSDIVAEPLVNIGMKRRDIANRVAEVLDVVGLSSEHARRYPHEFSGGQRQRIGIARALAARPRLIVCDEAVSALDVSVQAQILNLLRQIQLESNVALVFISHNLGVVRFLCHRIAVLYLGRIVEIADRDALFSRPRHPYTKVLLASVPEPGTGRGRIPVPGGEIPNPIDAPSGCAFHKRCTKAREICSREAPPMTDHGGGHQAACHFPLTQTEWSST